MTGMHKKFTYFLFFAVLWLVQTFLFDQLTVSIYLNPLVYVAFVALLPLETSRGAVLLAGLASGLAADWAMGAAGVNTISTVLVAFLRPGLLNLLFGKENIRDGGLPSPERFGDWGFLRYLLAVVLLHHFVFFALESLSWAHAGRMLLRLAVSGAVTVGCTWLAARVLTAKLTVKV